jgi:hypothetical protein
MGLAVTTANRGDQTLGVEGCPTFRPVLPEVGIFIEFISSDVRIITTP